MRGVNMETVGIRKLKENLSLYLRKVKSGDSIMVTDRKNEIAVIIPVANGEDGANVLKLIARGLAEWSGGKPEGMAYRILSKGESVSIAVLEDRN
jgi:prevent-host-death family protein